MKKILSLVFSLTAISAVCAGVLAYVNSVTEGPIRATKEKNVLRAAGEVMPEAVVQSTVEAVAWADGAKTVPVAFAGRDAAGAVAGYAVKGADSGGYGGDIELMVGLAPDRRTVVRYKTLAAAETPGLGMKLKDPSFSGQFSGKDGSALSVRKDGGDIDAITSATITSRAVCKAIADACARAASL
jgi:electron transport complex protein RnfG